MKFNLTFWILFLDLSNKIKVFFSIIIFFFYLTVIYELSLYKTVAQSLRNKTNFLEARRKTFYLMNSNWIVNDTSFQPTAFSATLFFCQWLLKSIFHVQFSVHRRFQKIKCMCFTTCRIAKCNFNLNNGIEAHTSIKTQTSFLLFGYCRS